MSWPAGISRDRVMRIVREDMPRIRVEDHATEAHESASPMSWRDVWGGLFVEHRDRLLEARGLGHNHFPVDEINERARKYANECCRLAERMA